MRREYIAWFDMPKSGKLHGQSVMPKQELIRCKDCKYFVDEEDQSYCIEMYGQCSGNGFCAWAERKEE